MGKTPECLCLFTAVKQNGIRRRDTPDKGSLKAPSVARLINTDNACILLERIESGNIHPRNEQVDIVGSFVGNHGL